MNNKAQFHVLEAVIAVSMIFLSLAFVSQQLSVPKSVVVPMDIRLKAMCDEALYSIRLAPSDEDGYDNLLIQYVIEDDTANLTAALNEVFPPDVFYNIWVYVSGNRSLWYPEEMRNPIGSVVVSHQVVEYNGVFYDIELEAWKL